MLQTNTTYKLCTRVLSPSYGTDENAAEGIHGHIVGWNALVKYSTVQYMRGCELSKDGQSVGRRADEARDIQGHGRQQESVSFRLLAMCRERGEIPELADRQAEHAQEPPVQH